MGSAATAPQNELIYRRPSGRTFLFAIPYPFASKDAASFVQAKTEIGRYEELPRAMALIDHFESDL